MQREQPGMECPANKCCPFTGKSCSTAGVAPPSENGKLSCPTLPVYRPDGQFRHAGESGTGWRKVSGSVFVFRTATTIGAVRKETLEVENKE